MDTSTGLFPLVELFTLRVKEYFSPSGYQWACIIRLHYPDPSLLFFPLWGIHRRFLRENTPSVSLKHTCKKVTSEINIPGIHGPHVLQEEGDIGVLRRFYSDFNTVCLLCLSCCLLLV